QLLRRLGRKALVRLSTIRGENVSAIPDLFRLEPADGGLWDVISASKDVVFRGTLQDCEDWLDAYEAAQGLCGQPSLWERAVAGIKSLSGTDPRRALPPATQTLPFPGQPGGAPS